MFDRTQPNIRLETDLLTRSLAGLVRSALTFRPHKITGLNLSKAARICATLILVLYSASSYAQDVLAEIAKHQERIEKIENDFMASQRRILASANTSSAQDLTYDQLTAVGNLLSSANREFGALTQLLVLAALVTDKRALPQARRIVEAQKEFMARRFQNATDFTEKTLARATDSETNRLLLEARDIRLKTSDSKGSAAK